VYAMFRAENLWGEFGRDLQNTRHPEANMLGRAADKELMGLHVLFHESKGESKAMKARSEVYGQHELLRCAAVGIEGEPLRASMSVSNGAGEMRAGDKGFEHLHKMYIGLDREFSTLWQEFVEEKAAELKARHRWSDAQASRSGAEGGWEFAREQLPTMHAEFAIWGSREDATESERALSRIWPRDLQPLRIIRIQGEPFKVGDWVCARPNEDDVFEVPDADQPEKAGLPKKGVPVQMWFGEVKKMWRHSRSFGLQDVDFFEVQWHRTVSRGEGGPYDVQLQSPIVYKRPDPESLNEPFCAAKSVLPIKSMACDHPAPSVAGQRWLVLIRETWQPMAAAGLPVPYPPLVKYQ